MLSDFLTPAIVSVVVTSILSPLLFFLLKARHDRKNRQLEFKYREFRAYLGALDRIAQAGREDFERFMNTTIATYAAAAIRGSESVIDLERELREFVLRTTVTFSQARSELNGLRLVASKGLLELVDQFIALQESMLQRVSCLLSDIKRADLASSVPTELRAAGLESSKLHELIVNRMRKELDVV